MVTLRNSIYAEKKEDEAVAIRSIQEHQTDIAEKKWNWKQKCPNPATVEGSTLEDILNSALTFKVTQCVRITVYRA